MASGLSRVTIVAPRSRVDLALPADVPLAEMLPVAAALRRHRPGRRSGRPARLDPVPARRPGAGQLAHPGPAGGPRRRTAVPAPARRRGPGAGVRRRRRRGRHRHPRPAEPLDGRRRTRRFGLARGGAGAARRRGRRPCSPGRRSWPAAWSGWPARRSLIGIATILSRALGTTRGPRGGPGRDRAYAAVGGLLVLAGDRTVGELAGPHLLVAATAALLAAALASIGIGYAATPVFLCAGAVAGAAALVAAPRSRFEFGPVPAAAVTLLVVLATLPMQPMIAYRLAGLPVPSLPAEREEMRQDAETVDGERVLARSRRADELLAGDGHGAGRHRRRGRRRGRHRGLARAGSGRGARDPADREGTLVPGLPAAVAAAGRRRRRAGRRAGDAFPLGRTGRAVDRRPARRDRGGRYPSSASRWRAGSSPTRRGGAARSTSWRSCSSSGSSRWRSGSAGCTPGSAGSGGSRDAEPARTASGVPVPDAPDRRRAGAG